MAKSMVERCDVLVGEKEGADFFVAIGSRKEEDETRYAFGAYLHTPAKFKAEDADIAKACLLWQKRDVSASNAGLPAKIKAEEMTVDEAAAIILSYDGEAYLDRLNETKVREGGAAKVDSTETLAIRILASVLKDKGEAVATAKTPVPRVDDPPKTEKGAVNFNAWAKILRDEAHPWYEAAKKQATQKKGFE